MTYTDKYQRFWYSTYNFYKDVLHNAEIPVKIGFVYPHVLDHVSFDDGDGGDDVAVYLITQIAISRAVDDAVSSIQRFASRCLAADKSEMMVKVLSRVNGVCYLYAKPINEILIFYGAQVNRDRRGYFNRACRRGMNRVITQAIDNGYELSEFDVKFAIESGYSETIKLVHGAYRGSYKPKRDGLNLINASRESMELCLSLNILERGTFYSFEDVPSIGVLQWILDHDMMKHDEMLIDISNNASRNSGHYFDMLKYLIEQHNFTVPRDILLYDAVTVCIGAVHLDVFDFLCVMELG